MAQRCAIPVDVKKLVLHESGYKCGNPACHSILTLDIHHLQRVADDGKEGADNLLPLCPNCHALHHRGEIPAESVRAWKMLLLSINEAFDKRTISLLQTISCVGEIYLSGDELLECAELVAGEWIETNRFGLPTQTQTGLTVPFYRVSLTDRGKRLISAWKEGNQAKAVAATALSNSA